MWPLITLFTVANQAVTNIKQNLLFNLIYNVATVILFGGLLVAAGILLSPGVGAALMIGQTALTLLNTYRFKRQALPLLPENHAEAAVAALPEAWESSYRKTHSQFPMRPVYRAANVPVSSTVIPTRVLDAGLPSLPQPNSAITPRRNFSH